MSVKCARGMRPRSTLRSLIYTPRGVTSAMFLSSFDVVVRLFKNKASVTPSNM